MMKKIKDLNITYEQIMSYGFVAVLSATLLLSFLPDRSFSESENRNLQTFPSLGVEDIIDKQFQKKVDAYQSDQFMGRDTWIHMKTNVDMMLGKKEFNQVYLGKDHQLFEDFKPVISNDEISTTINNFSDRYSSLDISFLLAPNAISILEDKLPTNAPILNQKPYIEELATLLQDRIHWIPTVEKLEEHKQEYIYYKNDHHWTTLGSYYAFEAFNETKSLQADVSHWTPSLVSNTFHGTLSGKSGYSGGEADDIYAYIPVDESIQYVVQYMDSQEKSTSVYKSENLNKKDQYSVFLNGNHPILEIDTTSKIDKRLLILKDSYANCMVPFLLPYYSKITIVDPRYYDGDLNKVIEDNEITDVLFLFNANTLYEDKSLSLLLDN